MHMKKRILCAALVLLLAAGCGVNRNGTTDVPPAAENSGTQAAKPATDGERLYSIPLGNWWENAENWVIDKDGNEVIAKTESDSDDSEYDLNDLATGEARYRYRTRDEIVRDKEGYPQTIRMCALYDLNGNLLLDWENRDFREAFGEYIIRQDSMRGIVDMSEMPDSFQSALYHVPTGTQHYAGAYNVANIAEDAFLLCDNMGTTLGIVNAAGEAVTGFPMEEPYYSAYIWNGFCTASRAHPYEQTKENRDVTYLLGFRDGNLYEMLSAEWISSGYGYLQGEYIVYRNGADWGVYQQEKGVVFTAEGASIEYYDGELAIVQKGSYRGNEPINAALVTVEHEELASGFSWLVPVRASPAYDDKQPAPKFIGLSGEKAVLIDRSGNVLAESPELPEMATANTKSVNALCDGLYVYYAETDASSGHGLLGANLEVLVPAGRYHYFDLAPEYVAPNGEWDGRTESTLLRATKTIGDMYEPGSLYLTDILDSTGKLIVDNVSDVCDIGPDRIALKRGFDIGLMDWNGNWIVKRSIFTNFGDD